MRIEASAKLTAEMERENQAKLRKGSLITMWIGIVGLIVQIIVSVFFIEEEKDPKWLEILLYVAAVLFACGLIFFLTAKKTVQKTAESGFFNEYVFEDTFVTVISSRGGEKIGEVKTYYWEFTKIRRTENYLFFQMGVKGAYPIALSTLQREEINTLCETVKKHIKK